MTGNPQPGQGQKKIDCTFYKDCLNHAANEDWGDFDCDKCEHGNGDPSDNTPGDHKKEDLRLCVDCGKNPTLSSSCPYCASCMSKRSHKKKQAARKDPGGPKKEKTTTNTNLPEKSPEKRNMKLIIDFGKYGNILDRIEELAEEEVRPVDLQVIYMLKKGLE